MDNEDKMNPFLLPKEHPDLPDNYELAVDYITGGTDKFEVAAHYHVKDLNLIRFVTKNDKWSEIPFASIKKISYDDRYSKKVAIWEEIQREKLEKEKQEKDVRNTVTT